MPFLLKLLITNLIIIGCVQIGNRLPATAGLIATMPITTLAVMLWLKSDSPGDNTVMIHYTRGVLWGIIPTVLFFATALFCFRRGMTLQFALAASFAVWIIGASLHHWFLR